MPPPREEIDAAGRTNLRNPRRAAYISSMTRVLALACLLSAGPALSQEAAQALTVTASPSPEPAQEEAIVRGAPEGAPAIGPVEDGAAAGSDEDLDPVAQWEADRTRIFDAADVNLQDFIYVARPLIVFADTPRQPQFMDQLAILESDMAALAARDVVVIVDSDPAAASEARRTQRPRGFALVLIEKDGRVLLRRPVPQTIRELTRTIDRSPLRQEEIRYRGRGAGLP